MMAEFLFLNQGSLIYVIKWGSRFGIGEEVCGKLPSPP
jgi:hypothetical protein